MSCVSNLSTKATIGDQGKCLYEVAISLSHAGVVICTKKLEYTLGHYNVAFIEGVSFHHAGVIVKSGSTSCT